MRITENGLLDSEKVLAERGFTKIQSEYIDLKYFACWLRDDGKERVCFQQIDPGTSLYETWYIPA